METMRSPWAGRFIGLTLVLGGVAWAILTFLVLGNVLAGLGIFTLGPVSSRIVAGGGAGSWFTMGILAYGLVAIGGLGLTALFYQHIEGGLGSSLAGWKSIGAGIHLLLGGLGSAGASLLMAWGGFQAGAALLTPDIGGGGQNVGYLPADNLHPVPGPNAAPLGNAPPRH